MQYFKFLAYFNLVLSPDSSFSQGTEYSTFSRWNSVSSHNNMTYKHLLNKI